MLANYITLTSEGDKAIMDDSGFDLSKVAEPIHITQPVIVVTDGPNSGDFILRTKEGKGARSFMYQYCIDPMLENCIWVSASSTSRTYTVKGLQKTKIYWCRVGAVGGNGQLVFSNAVSRVAQ